MSGVFNIPAFIVCFRETSEVSVVISSLLLLVNAMLSEDKAIKKKIKMAIWLGMLAGLILTAILATGILLAISSVGPEVWGRRGSLWEGILALVGAIFMTFFAFGTMRIKDASRHDSEFMNALTTSLRSESGKSRFLPIFLLPFITVAREGLETIFFVVGLSGVIKEGWRPIPLSIILGIVVGALIGVLIRHLGDRVDHNKLMFGLSVLLILMASSLVAKAVWCLEHYQWAQYLAPDSDEGPAIQYDLSKVTFALDCCDPRSNQGIWGLLQIFVGWNNASYNSIHWTYFSYWVLVICGVIYQKLRYRSRLNLSSVDDKLMGKRNNTPQIGPPEVA